VQLPVGKPVLYAMRPAHCQRGLAHPSGAVNRRNHHSRRHSFTGLRQERIELDELILPGGEMRYVHGQLSWDRQRNRVGLLVHLRRKSRLTHHWPVSQLAPERRLGLRSLSSGPALACSIDVPTKEVDQFRGEFPRRQFLTGEGRGQRRTPVTRGSTHLRVVRLASLDQQLP
jgi:hypothetical protein